MPSRPSLVVFDLGGVLVRICRSWREACDRAGLHFDASVIEPQRIEQRKHLRRAYERGQMPCQEFFTAVARTTSDLYSAEQIRRLHDAWLIGEYPGGRELVDRLHAAAIGTGVLSNTNHAHWSHMSPADYPAANAPRHRHPSHLLGHSKPDEAIYRAFEQSVHSNGWSGNTGAILFFDDLAENVDAARRAGWSAELIDHTGDPSLQMRAALAARGVPL
ncbi:MAG: hypothetical protein H7Y88_02500 [Phycisphaerales bacterium]|nr:hypothetical protein [Phycisphaerales bacterium]